MIELSSREAVVEVQKCTQGGDCLELDQDINEATRGNYRIIILDVSALETISPLLISRIMEFWEKLWKSGKELQIRGCNEDMLSTFQFLRMDRYIQFIG